MLHDTWLIFLREVSQRRRQTFWLVVGLIQPLLYMFLYGPLVTRLLADGASLTSGWGVFVPALLLQSSLTQAMYVGLSLLVEYRAGVLERLWVAPISRPALLLGKLANIGVTVAVLSVIIILLCRLFFRFHAPLAGLALCVLLNVVVAVALASYSYTVALLTKNEMALGTALHSAMLPLLLLSGAFLPITAGSAPTWLYRLSRLNPIAYVMDTNRAVLEGDFSSSAALTGTFVLVALAAVGLWWSTRTFARDHE